MFLLVVILVLVLATYFLNQIKRPKNYPPGPAWFPIVGNLPELKKLSRQLGGSHLAFSELASKHKTNVLGLKLGSDYTVVVFSYSTIKSVLTEKVYEGRPDNFFMKLRSMGIRKGITGTDGQYWNTQRHFLVCHLRNLGYGKQPMELLVRNEIQECLSLLKNQYDEQIGKILAPFVINILWALVTGSRFSINDPRLNNLLELLNARSKVFDMSGGTLNMFPWVRFLAPEKSGYNIIQKLNKEFYELFMETISEHVNSWTTGRKDDIIYSFITEIKEGNADETFTVDQLVMVCLDLFIAGSQTTSNTLDFAFLMMIMHPDTQLKVQRCLDDAFNINQSIEYSDRHKTPFIEAVLLEVQRFCNVTPLIGPRRVLQDTVLEGYNIPKETTILISIHSIHSNENYWKDPEVFRPERFLNEEGQLFLSESVVPFGLGRRRCLGEALARNCLFTFFAEIMKKYSIELKPGSEKLTGVSLPGITLSPEPYRAQFIERF